MEATGLICKPGVLQTTRDPSTTVLLVPCSRLAAHEGEPTVRSRHRGRAAPLGGDAADGGQRAVGPKKAKRGGRAVRNPRRGGGLPSFRRDQQVPA